MISNFQFMDENYFNFQLEIVNIQANNDFNSNLLIYTNESENIFIKIKNGILKFLRKIIDFIKNIFKKDVDKMSKKNKQLKEVQDEFDQLVKDTLNDNIYPINVKGGDNEVFGNMNLFFQKYQTISNKNDEISDMFLDEYKKFKKDMNNSNISSNEIKSKYPNLIPENINDAIDKELGECKKCLSEIMDKKNFVKLTPGGQIKSDDDFRVINRMDDENKQNEKIIDSIKDDILTFERFSDHLFKEIKNIQEPEPDRIKMLNTSFNYTQKLLNGILEILNPIKNIMKKRIDAIYSIFKDSGISFMNHF